MRRFSAAIVLFSVLLWFCGGRVSCQETKPLQPASTEAQKPTALDGSDTTTIPESTHVKVAIMETLTSGSAKVNAEVPYEVREDVLSADGKILIAKGSTAYGTILSSQKPTICGKYGKLNITCDYVRALDGTRVPLRRSEPGNKDSKGNRGAAVADAASAVLVGALSGFVRGRFVTIHKGTEFTVYVAEDTAISSRYLHSKPERRLVTVGDKIFFRTSQ